MYNYEKDAITAFVILLIGIGLLFIAPVDLHTTIIMITMFACLITASGIARTDRD